MDFLILNPQSQVTLAGGSFTVVGRRDTAETIILVEPPQGTLTVNFDPSFNSGSDTIAFIGNAEDYTIRRSGSSVIITDGTITATIPVGLEATNIVFIGDGPLEEGDLRVLRADPPVGGAPGDAPEFALGGQVIEPGAPAQPIEPRDDAFAFTGSFSTSVEENQTAAFDADLVGDVEAVFGLGGADRALFEIDRETGIVSFITPPDFEMPADADGDNVYDVVIIASTTSDTISQAVSITVTDVDDPVPDPGPQVVTIVTGLRDAVAPTAMQENDAGRLNAAGDIVTAFGVMPAVTGRVGVDTELENLGADTRVVISGENQTVGEGNNDADQRFGIIELEDSAAENLIVELENTARANGQLTVDQLIVNDTEDPDGGEGSQVETLTINSGGERDTLNAIRELSAPEVENLVLTGSQALGIVIDTLAARTDLDLSITGAALGGPLVLGINGTWLDGGDDDVIIGTDSDDDHLALFGELDPGTDTTIDDFENLQFGTVRPSAFGNATQSPGRSVEGEFSLANVSGASRTFIVTNLSDALTLTDLSGDTVINVGDTTAGGAAPTGQLLAAANAALTFEGTDDDDSILVNLTAVIGQASDLLGAGSTSILGDPTPGSDFIDISGFEDVTLIVSRQAQLGNNVSDYSIDLRLDNAVGVNLDAAGGGTLSDAVDDFVTGAGNDAAVVDEIVQTLTISGGATGTADALDIGANILGSIGVIDVSGYHGTFIGEVVNTVDRAVGTATNRVQSANVDRTFIIGDDDVRITLQELTDEDSGLGASDGDAASIDTNTIFRFTDGLTTSGDADGVATWVIDNFVAGEFDNANVGNYSVLDFGGLGLTNFTQLTVETGTFNAATGVFTVDNVAGSDTRITDNSADWRIILEDVQAEDLLESENFSFSGSSDVGAEFAVAPAIEPAMGMMESFAFA